MNRELREVERWNDPAAAFLAVSCSCILSTVAFFSHIKVLMLISIRRKSQKGAKEDLYALMRRFRTASAYSQDSDGTEWVGHHNFYVYPSNPG